MDKQLQHSGVNRNAKVVDWARTYVPAFDLPLLTFYVTNDPTINHQSAVDYHKRWPLFTQKIIVGSQSSGVPKHIFVGDISGPEKNEWFVNMCLEFLDSIVDQQDVQILKTQNKIVLSRIGVSKLLIVKMKSGETYE